MWRLSETLHSDVSLPFFISSATTNTAVCFNKVYIEAESFFFRSAYYQKVGGLEQREPPASKLPTQSWAAIYPQPTGESVLDC